MLIRLNLVVAHKLEARPLIGLFNLRRISSSPAIYCNDEGLRLVVTGEGCQASAAAVQYLGHMAPASATAAWLNIGIAGHQSLAIGDSLLVNKILRRSDGACCFPVPLASQFTCGELHTVEEPEYAFPNNVAYDMEGFGFFEAAKQFTTLELVQCFKIVSDNAMQDASTVTAERIIEVLDNSSGEIKQLVSDLLNLQNQYQEFAAEPASLAEIAGNFHLTATQRAQLRRLLQRFQAFGMQQDLSPLIAESGSDSRHLLQSLRSHLQSVERAAG